MTPHDIIKQMEVPGEPGVFILGCFEERVTVYSQQVRALNLIHALFAEKWLGRGTPLAIVGGGVAGLTAAAGAAVRGCNVTVLEQQEDLLLLFRNNRTRWLHPHIYDWPEPSSENEHANLPVLSWRADRAEKVAEKLLEEWTPLEKRYLIEVHRNVQHVRLLPGRTAKYKLTWNSTGPLDGDFAIVILAVGFGTEKSFENVQSISYWTNDDLDYRVREPGKPRRRYLISGNGDGGMVDLLRIRIADFKHEMVVKDFLSDPALDAAKLKLLDIEKEVRQGHIHAEELPSLYRKLPVPRSLDEQLKMRLRDDTSAVLNGLDSTALNPGACILNRFLVSRLLPLGVPYIAGRFHTAATPEGFEVTFENPEVTEHFTKIVIRHGPESALKRSFKHQWEKSKARMSDFSTLDQTRREPLWKHEDFTEAPPKSASLSSGRSPVPAHELGLPPRGNCFGRDDLVKDLVEELVASPPRPTIILGPPGIGKSTLANEALHKPAVADRYGSRRYFVRLDGATSPELMVSVIASQLHVSSEKNLWEAVKKHLGDKPSLLVLDNAETPWQGNQVGTETLLHELRDIPGLALVCAARSSDGPFIPFAKEPIRVKPLAEAAARELFCSIATSVDETDPDLAELLNELDGLPLAIKLLAHAAERVPLSNTRRRWEQKRAALLSRPGGESLAAAVETSIDGPRMTETARRLLALLALLPGGIADDDLESLLPHVGDEAAAVLSKVSLAFFEADTFGGYRLRALAPLREQAALSLPPLSTDLERMRAYFFAVARDEGGAVGSTGGDKAMTRLKQEVVNIESLIRSGLQGNTAREAIDAAVALSRFVRFSGYASFQALQLARNTAKMLSDTKREADCIYNLGHISRVRYQYNTARSLLEEALFLYRQVGNTHGEAHSIQGLGRIAMERSPPDDARPYFEQALPLYRKIGHRRGQANCLQGLGDIALRLDQHDAAHSYFEKARELYHQVNYILGEANCLQGLGDIALARSRYGDAQSFFKQALPHYHKVGAILGEANCNQILGHIALQLSEHDARSYFEQAQSLYSRITHSYSIAPTLRRIGRLTSSPEVRRRHVSAARAMWQSIDRPDLVDQLRKEFGEDF